MKFEKGKFTKRNSIKRIPKEKTTKKKIHEQKSFCNILNEFPQTKPLGTVQSTPLLFFNQKAPFKQIPHNYRSHNIHTYRSVIVSKSENVSP